MAELPLLHAASIGDLKAVHRLLQEGHDVDERGEPLTADEIKSLRWLLNEAGVNEAAGAVDRPFDYTPLMAAIGEGHFEVALALLDAGADANAADSLRRTPLMLAIKWKHTVLAGRLIEFGADVNAKDSVGDPVLTQAIRKHAWQIVHTLLDGGAISDPSVKNDSLPLVAVSYESGPESLAIQNRLLDLGAKPHNSIPLANAVKTKDIDLIRRLVELGSPLNGTFWLDDPLSISVMHANHASTRYLLQQGAKILERQKDTGVLCYAASGGDDEDQAIATAEALIVAGANVNHADPDGYTPLHRAAEHGRAKFTRWLLERGANPNKCWYGEKTPLDLAVFELEMSLKNFKDASRSKSPDTQFLDRLRQRIEQIPKVMALLERAGGRRAKDSMCSPDQQNPILATYPARRRGLCDVKFFKAYQVMIRADMDRIAGVLEKDRKFVSVDRDVYQRLDELERPVGDVLSIVKLKGQSWVYVTGRRPQGDNPMMAWSKKLKSPVLYAGEESVASVVFYALYDSGKCVEAFESDGQWFRGGIEIDPDVQEESDRMYGTSFSSQLRDADAVDWSAYKSEWEFLEQFLRDQDAYLTFIGATFTEKGRGAVLQAYHDDEVTADAIERVDLAYYKPTALQERAAKMPSEEIDTLYEAIKSGDLDEAKQAVERGVKLNELPPRNDASYLRTALECALWNGKQEIVDFLLKSGADPNFGGDEPPLSRMIRSSQGPEQMKVVIKLLAAGADVNGCKPLSNANPFMPGGETALHKAAATAQLNYVKLLLRYGADPTLLDGAKRTPLDAARGWLKAVKLDRIKDVPAFTNELHVPIAVETVMLLETVERGELDISTLPNDEELIKAEEQLHMERRRADGDIC